MAKQIKKIANPDLKQILTPTLLGQAIRARRTQSKLRIEDAAALCGLAKQTYMKIEHGQQNTQFSCVLRICSALGIKLLIAPWQDTDETDYDWK
ncbi:MAG TPA: helix-turn-helix transcriptional regulator [Gammaproteobacteria bacterium]|nr:helix-turn-helix transcriptional regulator [Gammaproteobacteria bacterium]